MKRTIILLVFCLIIISGCNTQKEISGVLEIPGAIFQYTAEGSGTPCVVFTGSENIGHKLYTDELRNHITFIHADPKNIQSERIKNITLETIIDDIEKVRKALGFKKIAVMGHSMFGPIPLEYALKYPENISFSITTGGTPYRTEKYFQAVAQYWESEASVERKKIRKDNHKRLEEKDKSLLSENDLFWEVYNADVPYRFYDPRFDMTDSLNGIDANINFFNHFRGTLMQDFDNTENYINIKTPVLVIAGKYDFGAPYYLWEDLKNIIPDFTFHLFENAGHNPMFEIPEEFDSVVIEWIKSH